MPTTASQFSLKPPAVIAAVMLLLAAFFAWPYGYYGLLRWVVCVASTFIAYHAWHSRCQSWMWVMGLIAVVFNPIVPVRLDRDTWRMFDLLAVIVLPIGAWPVDRRSCTTAVNDAT